MLSACCQYPAHRTQPSGCHAICGLRSLKTDVNAYRYPLIDSRTQQVCFADLSCYSPFTDLNLPITSYAQLLHHQISVDRGTNIAGTFGPITPLILSSTYVDLRRRLRNLFTATSHIHFRH